MIVMIDNGHGRDTAGKRSPDGRLAEWKFTREIALQVVESLRRHGIDTRLLVTEDCDVALAERCRRANTIAVSARGGAVLVSIHCNAAGRGDRWMNARGWSVHIAPSASAQSIELASTLFDTAERVGLQTRRASPARKYWEQSLAICRNTRCPAVLTENLFQDNREDVDLLLSASGREAIVELHVAGIMEWIKNHNR